MAIKFSHLISDSGVVTVFVNGRPHTFAADYPSMDKVKKAIHEKDSEEIVRLSSLPRAIESYAGSTVTVEHGVIKYKGKPLHNNLTKRILKLMSEGFPFTPMLKFLEKLMQNTSFHAVNELYNFLIHRNLPITEDGNFLAYKAVKADYMDWHSGTIRNQVGDNPPRLERNQCDDDWRKECSSGYHVGAIEYVSQNYGSSVNGSNGHVVIVEVDPQDVISVPTDSSFQKCRVCFYTVVGEMDGELLAQVYKTTPSSYTPSTPASFEAAPVTAGATIGSMSNVHDDDDDYPEDEDEDLDDDEDEDEDDEDDGFGPSEP